VWEQRIFYFDGFLNYVDVTDVTKVIYDLLYSPIEGERFIVSAGNISYRDFFGMIATEFNKKAPSVKLSKNFLKIGAAVESFRSWISGSEPRLTRETARLAGSEFLFENKKIKNKLNFEFQPIDKTLQRCCEYYIGKMKSKK
jgi:nucleoside-diphosphate-sugar epimerase